MSWLGRKASEGLDNARPQSAVGKAVVGAAKVVRAVDRAATRDPHNSTGGDPNLCHMRARRRGKECGNRLKTRQQYEQQHCGHHLCANEMTYYQSHPDYNERFDTTHRHVRRW